VEKIRVGVVGVGYLGQFHAEKYAKMEGAELVGVADVDPLRAKEIAERYRTRPFFHHSELLGKVQAVSIAVPTTLHHAIGKDFLTRGVDVLIEKPISGTLEDADELIRLAESKELLLQVGHLERFNSALLAVEGTVRNPLFIESRRLAPFPKRGTDVSVVLDTMIHDIDLLLSWVPSRVTGVYAAGIPILTQHLDVANARIEFENGCVANLTASRVSRDKARRTQIFQPSGCLSIDFLSQRATFARKVSLPGEGGMPDIVTEEIPVRKSDPLETEIHAFLQSARDRKGVRVSGRDGRRALELALRIVEKIDEFLKKNETWGRLKE
jgi:predicted dehydrogenase